jgi:hypothetical protein
VVIGACFISGLEVWGVAVEEYLSKFRSASGALEMSKVIFVNRFYAPDYSATSQLLSDLATALARLGHDVHVLASNHLYNDDQTELPLRETIEGVSVHRVVTARPARANLLRRAVAYLSDYRAFFRGIRELANAGDIVRRAQLLHPSPRGEGGSAAGRDGWGENPGFRNFAPPSAPHDPASPDRARRPPLAGRDRP